GEDSQHPRDGNQKHKRRREGTSKRRTTKKTKMKKLVYAIALCLVPTGVELLIDYQFYWAKAVVDNHLLTAGFRIAFMLALSALNNTVKFWQSLLLTFSFHLLFFPIQYNLVVIHQPFDFLGTTAWSDVVEQKIRDVITTPGVLFFKIALFMSAVNFYINPKVR